MKEIKDQTDMNGFMIGIKVLTAIVVIVVFLQCFYIVSAGERAVLSTFGNPSMKEISEGLHLKIPVVQSVVIMDIKTQKYEADLTAASKDLQDVNTKIAINYRLTSDKVPEIYKTIGISYADKVIYPMEQEINKATTAKFTAEELITKRDAVREKMKSDLYAKLLPRGIIVEEISIINFKFSDSFTQAIELKVTAEQNALAAKNKLAQTEYEAQQRVAQATGEADAIIIQTKAIMTQGGENYIKLQQINKWNGVLPVVTSTTTPFIDISTIATPATK